MDFDLKFSKKKLPDKINSSITKEKGAVFSKSVGCSSLMVKKFENNASLLKLGIGRVSNLAPPPSIVRSNSPIKDAYTKLLSSPAQTSVQFFETQNKPKELQQDPKSHPNTPIPLSQFKPKNPGYSCSSNDSSDSSTNSNDSNSPECSSQNGPFQSFSPHKPLNSSSSYTTCPILGKNVNPTSDQHTQKNSSSNFSSIQNTNKLITPLTQTHFTQDLEGKISKDPTDILSSLSDVSNKSKGFMSNSFEENLNSFNKLPEISDFNSNNLYYGSVFEDIDQSIPMLKQIFISQPNAANEDTPLDKDDEFVYKDKFEWIPTDPSDSNVLTTKGDIVGLFEDNFEEDSDGFLVSNYYNQSQVDLDEKLFNLSTIHESLYTSSESATLRTLEKFLFQLLQQKSHYGNLTPFGKLLAFINLSFLKKHISLLDSLYKHPEMSVIRNVLAANTKGQITKTLNSSAGISEGYKLSNEESVNLFTQVLNKTNKDCPVPPAPMSANIKGKNLQQGNKQNKQRLSVLDTLSGMYKPGGEPHFPRYVCGSIDRSLVTSTETLSIPFEKTEKHNIHVQFERFDNDNTKMWPKLTTLPQNISEGTFVQVAPLKYTGNMTWKAGMVVSVSSGQLSIRIPNEQKERMYLLRNLVPPNVPIVKPDKGYWRLLPRELDVSAHLYVGSCLSLLDLAEPDESVDVVVLNVFYSTENSPIAPVKLPSDETNFQHTKNQELEEDANSSEPQLSEPKLRSVLPDLPSQNTDKLSHQDSETSENRPNAPSNSSSGQAKLEEGSSDSKDVNEFYDALEYGDESYSGISNDSKEFKESKNSDRNDSEDKISSNYYDMKSRPFNLHMSGTCTCNGYTLRIFEGRCLGMPQRILVQTLHDKKEHVLKVSELKGFKLNYDLQAHFDGPTGNAQVHNNVWVVPRNISFLGDTLMTKDSYKPGYSWLFKPEYCLVMFPFSRNVDVLQEFCRVIPFLHPELNYLALCAGLWSLRNKPELRERESVSFTRSQKAAIRDLTSNDVVSEVCMDLARCPFSLIRRLYGCFPVISFWIALDSYDFDSDKEPMIPNNIKVPKPTMCDKCNGVVISKTGMVKIISNKYTQILAKKLSRRAKDVVTTNPSLETLPQLDESTNKTGATQTSKELVDSADKELDHSDKDVSGPNADSFGSSKDLFDKDGSKSLKTSQQASDKEDKHSKSAETSDHEHAESGSDTQNVDDQTKKGAEVFSGSGSLSKSNEDSTGNLAARSGPSTKIYDAIFSPNVEYDMKPVLSDLERAEDWVKKLQSLANSRWRVTKEFNASYTVDDEFSMLTTSPTPTTTNKPNSEFIIQLAGVMNNIKRGKDSHIDSNLVYKLYQLAEECTSTTEGALLTGWSSYLLSEPKIFQPEEQPLIQPLPPVQTTNGARKEKDCPYSNMCPMNFNCPRGTNCPYASTHTNICPLKPPMNTLNGLQPMNPINHQLNCPIRKCNIDFSNNYTKLLLNNPIINMPTSCKRKRDEEYKKLAAFNKIHKKNRSVGTLLPKLGVPLEQSSKNIAKESETENPFINDPYDFCKFTDNPKRKKFISSLKWDEDVEF